MKKYKGRILCLMMFFGFLFPVIQIEAQQIIIDKPVKAGELTLFPEMGNENVYYYLPDKLRLATDENGKPQFSFIKYVENVRSAPGEKDIREGTGGGIVHFVISLSVTPDQIAEAKNELRKINSSGTIKGPVIYRSGTVSVISSFANTKGDLTKQVVGIGNAPLIDGEKAAVSMELSKKGAKILWESFKMPTPDISFSFEMELGGFRAPKKAIIEANFDKIYSHHGFDAAATGNYGNVMFGGEIELAFDDLRNNGAIKITSMGSDADMDKLIETAYNKLTTMIFNPVGTGNPVVEKFMNSITGKKSALDRATELYNKEKNKSSVPAKTTGKKKTAYNFATPINDYNYPLAFNDYKSKGPYDPSNLIFNLPADDGWKVPDLKDFIISYINTMQYISDKELTELRDRVKNNEEIDFLELRKKNIAEAKKKVGHIESWFDIKPLLTDKEFKEVEQLLRKDTINIYSVKEKYIEPRLLSIIKNQKWLTEYQRSMCEGTTVLDLSFTVEFLYLYWRLNQTGIETTETATASALTDAMEEARKVTKDDANKNQDISVPPDDDNNIDFEKLIKELTSEKDTINKQIDNSKGITSKNSSNKNNPPGLQEPADVKNQKNKPAQSQGHQTPVAAAAASKPQGKTTGTGKNKPTTKPTSSPKEKTDFKMAVMATYQFKKIRQRGKFKINLNKYTADKLLLRFDENIGQINCKECFKEVNLDDPMFKQREIVAILDGFNFDDFGKYINYVNLKMKKTHQNGDVTVDEVRIDRENFLKSANNFKLMYGWKGDNDRTKWFDYDIQTQWSFFGGNEISTDWKKVNTNIINLAAPYVLKTIDLESDPELIKENKVRMINVKIYYKVGDSEQVKQVALLPYKEQYSETVDILLPNNDLKYDYEISWRLYGNKTKTTGRQSTTEPILFVDEL